MDLKESATKEMVLIEALKMVKRYAQRIIKSQQEISNFCSILSNEKCTFEGGEDAQKRHVSSLIQQCEDWVNEATILKMRIDLTNINTVVEIDGMKFTLSQLIQMKQTRMGGFADLMINTYDCLNTKNSVDRRRMNTMHSSDQPIQVVALYKEQDRINGISKWTNIRDKITGRLEVENAKTSLLPLPDELIVEIGNK